MRQWVGSGRVRAARRDVLVGMERYRAACTTSERMVATLFCPRGHDPRSLVLNDQKKKNRACQPNKYQVNRSLHSPVTTATFFYPQSELHQIGEVSFYVYYKIKRKRR